MSSFRRVLVVLGLLLLLASLALLVIANLPNERLQDRQPIPAQDLALPTPQAFRDPGQLTVSLAQPPSSPWGPAAALEAA